MTTIKIPELSLVVLVGITGSGKSTFAARHFRPTEVLSSDVFRGLVGDDENDQSVTAEAFAALHAVAAQRLKLGRLTVIDATNVLPDARRPLVELAREYHVLPVAIVLDVPEPLCAERNTGRPGRDFGRRVVARQHAMLTRSVGRLEREGFRRVFVLRGVAGVDGAQIVREAAWSDRSALRGPSTSSATCTDATTSWQSCWACSGTRRGVTARGRTRPGAPRCSSATSSTAARTLRACCAR